VPYDLAMGMSPRMALAHTVAIGENNGGTFHWGAMRWEKRI
jgi:hypothetical protein